MSSVIPSVRTLLAYGDDKTVLHLYDRVSGRRTEDDMSDQRLSGVRPLIRVGSVTRGTTLVFGSSCTVHDLTFMFYDTFVSTHSN